MTSPAMHSPFVSAMTALEHRLMILEEQIGNLGRRLDRWEAFVAKAAAQSMGQGAPSEPGPSVLWSGSMGQFARTGHASPTVVGVRLPGVSLSADGQDVGVTELPGLTIYDRP